MKETLFDIFRVTYIHMTLKRFVFEFYARPKHFRKLNKTGSATVCECKH